MELWLEVDCRAFSRRHCGKVALKRYDVNWFAGAGELHAPAVLENGSRRVAAVPGAAMQISAFSDARLATCKLSI